jgi:hypothetical protein
MNQLIVSFFSEGTKVEGDLFLPADLSRQQSLWRPSLPQPSLVLCSRTRLL